MGGLKDKTTINTELNTNEILLLIDLTDNFKVCRHVEPVTTSGEMFNQVFSDVASGDLHLHHHVLNQVVLGNWNNVSNTITTVKNNTGDDSTRVSDMKCLRRELSHRKTQSLKKN